MRTISILIATFSLLPAVFAAPTALQIPPDSLDGAGWKVLGANREALQPNPDGWLLPANGQVFRSLTADQSGSIVTVTLRARPQFAVRAEDCPAVDLGEVAVMFMRTGSVGRLVVLTGGTVVDTLAGAVALDANGRSNDALIVQLSFDPAKRQYAVTALGQTVPVPTNAALSSPTEFALSAGTDAGLNIAALEMTFADVPALVASTTTVSAALSQSNAKAAQARDDQDQEQAVIATALQQCLDGKPDQAWRSLQQNKGRGGNGSAPTPAEIGWRTATVVGFLKNQSKYAQAAQIAQQALSQPWSQAARQSSEASYWGAWIAVEGSNDRTQALQWLGSASATDPVQTQHLRTRLQAAIRSFPRQ